ncbi:uncharacterized protein EAE98_005713 [Botrytis deweyae]|uniref:Heterokaryon incompatibility domain-containing protein n=1 Tax=Botrytis deweyae TaxID=2478750 RepID=A0ABQ7INF8_9HELO|nr:uncharacterized protein EAE98_005713 [Botrytis deweyae]KAF7928657.1 hypothetical protein EAE98_005713 [Botrytis deweyae]
MASLAADFLKNMQVDMAFFMAKLLQRTYFSRIWIFQEIVLGSVQSIVVCGASRFSWENLLRCGRVLIEGINAGYPNNMSLRLHPMKSMNEGDEYLTFGDLHVGLTKLHMLRTAIFESQLDDIVGQPVLGYDPFWLRIPSSYEASDSRDLIHGMMSLLPSWLTDLINVNYSTNNHFVDVMRSLAEAYIKSTQSLQWILRRYHTPFLGYKDWPTWVPNLTQKLDDTHWQWSINTENQACPGIPIETSFEKDEVSGRHLLVCKGTQIDVIDMATENTLMKSLQDSPQDIDSTRDPRQFMIPDFGDSDEERKHQSNDHKEPISKTHQYGNMEDLKAALNSCLSCVGLRLKQGQNIFNFPLGISDDEALPQMPHVHAVRYPIISLFNQLRRTFSSIPLWGTTFKELFPQKAADVESSSYSNPVMNTKAAIFERLFITESGYIGMTLGSIRSGDEVWLLAGCDVPVLLRKSQKVIGAYELLGGVYIPGIMKGEALDGRENVEFENVSIC